MPTDSHKHAFSGIMLVEQSLRIQQKEKKQPDSVDKGKENSTF